ncbi:sulfatase family protein [Aliiglaciecola lipolytica]|uniref:sulfatase family protein n=1 Tax=Aliiglaciecola lipolytica TaxID=477689 RepID=UPI001C084DC2|nr:arylsulfatase [Aliiglaciecola lipolytica]MBU2877931.1 arylsulfatase [Aliiglaciecola lipolytica]
MKIFARTSLLKNVTLLCVIFTLSPSVSADTSKPNIVYILADDMGYGDIQELAPHGKIKTKNLDRIAQEGIAFSQAYTGSSICTPTRYGLMTGRYPWRENVNLAANYGSRIMPEGQETVATFLRSQGYKTLMVGKWHLGTSWTMKDGSVVKSRQSMSHKATLSEDKSINFSAPFYGGPTDHGFDSWFGIAGSLDFAPYVYLVDNKASKIPTEHLVGKNRFGHRTGFADPDLEPSQVLGEFTKRTVAAIEQQNKDEPFFLYMPLNAPHSPVVPSKAFQGLSKIGPNADYRMEIDWTVGQVLDALDRKGLSENTLVIFTADNGSYPGATIELKEAGHDTHDGRRGEKATLFEGGHRVPFLVKWPKGIKGELNRRENDNITLEDFIATTADILGQPTPDYAVDSVSFLPQLQGKEAPVGQREVIISSLHNILIARDGEWKLIYKSLAEIAEIRQRNQINAKKLKEGYFTPKSNEPWYQHVTLFNLKDDQGETVNIARQNPEIVARLHSAVQKSIKDQRTNKGEPKPKINWQVNFGIDADQQRRLAILDSLQSAKVSY